MIVTRERLLSVVIVTAALFAFYLPSSVAGVISRPLSVISIGGSCVLLGAMIASSGRVAPAANVAVSLAMLGLLAGFTVTSGFQDYSPGVVVIYLGLALLYMLDLRNVQARWADLVFRGLTVVSLVLGYALALDIRAADDFVGRWYNAFYQELLSNMVVVNNKPVLTFATHSMAGFMVYLLFYVQWHAWRSYGGWWRGAAAVGYLGLLGALASTTSMAFGIVAAAQLTWQIFASSPRQVVALSLVALFAAVAAAAVLGLDPATLVERVQAAIVGDRIQGLFSRYAPDGLLASSMAYLSESPFSPIGFSSTESLYLGDSGIVVNLLRGSLPLLLLVYGGLWLFLRVNLRDSHLALWLWFCLAVFEIGFTPLHYFRLVAFLPFLVVCLNAMPPPADSPVGAPAVRR